VDTVLLRRLYVLVFIEHGTEPPDIQENAAHDPESYFRPAQA
jgi:hypothetical protein